MEFECTRRFKDEYKKLKRKNSKIESDLNKDLFSLSIDELFNHFQCLTSHPTIRIKKHRCRNTNKNQSASGGYRIYFQINKETKKVRLMTIYPKVANANKGKESLTDKEEKEIREELKKEAKSNSLIKLKIEDNNITFLVPEHNQNHP